MIHSLFWRICGRFSPWLLFTRRFCLTALLRHLYYWLTWLGGSPALSFNHVFQCVWQTAAPFHVINFPCRLLDGQTHGGVRSALEHRHKNVHLALCTDDSTRQVKHSIVKFCGPKSAFYGGKTLDELLLPLVFLPSLSLVCQQRPTAAYWNRTSP